MKLPKETIQPEPAHGRWYDDACGSAFGMELLGERWSLLILRELMFGPRRFSDLRADLPGISAKVLTERLAGMERSGILCRATLSDPAPAQVYRLTPWGQSAEPILQEIGRWAAASPQHDPTLPLSAASFMMSLRTMLDRQAAAGLSVTAAMTVGNAHFSLRLAQSRLEVVRGRPDAADLAFEAETAPRLAALFYGNVAPEVAGVTCRGAPETLRRFIDLFNLPEKTAAPNGGGSR